MRRKYQILFALITILAASLACANPIETSGVETVVAQTLQALTVPAPGITPPPSSSGLLPYSLYYLNNDSAGLLQVYRLGTDGVTVSQVTFEPANVEDYDVSRRDGSVVYVSNNQLLLVNADGSNRRLLLDGGPLDPNNGFVSNINGPVFSPNGETIAYGYRGLNFYSLATGTSNLLIPDLIEDQGNGLIFPRELIWPEMYSADGTKLIVTLGYYEGASAAIYYPGGGALVRLTGDEGALICCGETELTPDGSAFYAANPTVGMFIPGMWRVDTATGATITLLSSDTGAAINSADEPFLAPDGNLYYFYTTLPATDVSSSHVPLQLVRSAPDGITNRTVLRPETFGLMNEALWAPDGSLVITAMAPIQDVYVGGAPEIVYTDPAKATVSLVPFAINMKWGP
jgi:Tol biopolymer transport system component